MFCLKGVKRMNFHSKKVKRVITTIIAIILILAMVVPIIVSLI